jgi:hypothetical protein
MDGSSLKGKRAKGKGKRAREEDKGKGTVYGSGSSVVE